MAGGMSYTVKPSYGSIQFNGTSQYLTVPGNAAFNFGTGNFTFECWVYINAYSATTGFFTVGNEATGRYYFALQNSGQPWSNQYGGANFTWGTATSVPLNAWTHIAWVNVSGTVSCYVNGTSLGTQTFSGQVGNAGGVWVGANPSGGYLWSGYISNLRLSNVAVYTSNFTPSAAPLTSTQSANVNGSPSAAITGSSTSLLLNMPNNASYLTDTSSFNNTITNTGAATSQALTPFGIGSVLLNGTSQYLSTPSSAPLDFGTGNFTVELWVYFTSATGGYKPILANLGAADQYGWVFITETANQLAFYSSSGTAWTYNIVSSYVPAANAWTHLAVSRVGTVITMYANGVSIGTTTIGAAAIGVGTITFNVGYYPYFPGGGRYLNGYISNIRAVKGVAVYTSNFVPPTGPLTSTQLANQNGNPSTAITGTSTSLLLNTWTGVNAFKDSSPAPLTITNNGTATSASFNPFGL